MESFKKIFILYFGNTINYTEVESKSFKTTLYAIYSFFFLKRKEKERKERNSNQYINHSKHEDFTVVIKQSSGQPVC